MHIHEASQSQRGHLSSVLQSDSESSSGRTARPADPPWTSLQACRRDPIEWSDGPRHAPRAASAQLAFSDALYARQAVRKLMQRSSNFTCNQALEDSSGIDLVPLNFELGSYGE